MQDVTFDPSKRVVWLSGENEPTRLIEQGKSSVEDVVRILHYQPERVEIAVKMATPGWLVLSDTYYPGWRAELDGQTAEIFRANLNFRGVAIPAGEHRLIFEYQPRSVQIGAWLTGVALLGWGLGLGITARGRK
jgi:uncharacterized membrane protein YfhO